MDSREYKHKEAIRYTRSRPLACQGIMKNYFQCVDYYHYDKNQELNSVSEKCLEKFNYKECLVDNKEKIWENWYLNTEQTELE